MTDESPGEIITFYSYKGGTGRTMALANVACLLAERQSRIGGKGVLMIDWDLEAPGLHKYFQNRLKRTGALYGSTQTDDAPGLIDIFRALDQASRQVDGGTNTPDESVAPGVLGSERLAYRALDIVRPELYALETSIQGLHLIKAGRFNDADPEEYSRHVNTFRWDELYKRSPMLIRLLGERLAAKYQYVLIDSRTGITDISGICTMLMPEKLVAVFTPNSQSLKGAVELIKRATDYRRESHDLRPLTVFPLVSRVEANEPVLREQWRFGNEENNIPGFQREFEKLFNDIYKRDVKLEDYFDEMQIQHIPHYAYGEEIAVLVERIGDKFSLKRSYQSFANRLVSSKVPWDRNDSIEGDAQHSSASFVDSIRPALSYLIKNQLPIIWVIAVVGIALFMFRNSQVDGLRARVTESEQAGNQARLDLESTKLAYADATQKLNEAQQPARVIEDLRNQIKSLSSQLDDQRKETDKEVKAAQQEAIDQRKIRKQREDLLQSTQREADDCSTKLKTQYTEVQRLTLENQRLDKENRSYKANAQQRKVGESD